VPKWVHADPVTKSQRLTDYNLTLVAVVDLDPWGGETDKSWGQGKQPHKYTTYERDGNGNDQAMNRQYHSYWQRFDQPDPFDGSASLTDPQSLNRYAYVQNDPVNFVDPSGLNLSSGTCYTYGHYTRWDFGDGKSVTILNGTSTVCMGGGGGGGLYTGTPGIGGGGGGGQQNPGGRFTPDQQADVDDLKDTVRELLKNPDCARVLGGTKNAQALMSRAQVRSANTLSSSYKGTAGLYSRAASRARSEANNSRSNILAFSESSPFASVNGRTVLPRNIYLTDRFFTDVGPSQQETVFIHELNRLNGYSGGYREDYANITKACGTADPFGPRQ
jgi:RHS repeat-associated protein